MKGPQGQRDEFFLEDVSHVSFLSENILSIQTEHNFSPIHLAVAEILTFEVKETEKFWETQAH